MRRNRRFNPRAVRDARRTAGLSRQGLAAAVGVSPATVKAWETGARAPLPAAQVRLADVLGVGFEDLEVPGRADPDLRGLRVAAGLTQADAAAPAGSRAVGAQTGRSRRGAATGPGADGEGVRGEQG